MASTKTVSKLVKVGKVTVSDKDGKPLPMARKAFEAGADGSRAFASYQIYRWTYKRDNVRVPKNPAITKLARLKARMEKANARSAKIAKELAELEANS